MQETLSIKISALEKARLRKAARTRGVGMSTLLREGLKAVTDASSSAEKGTCYELARHYFEEPGRIGSSGRGDLSVNKSALRHFGRKR